MPHLPEQGIVVRRIPGRGNTLRWVAFNAKVTKDIERALAGSDQTWCRRCAKETAASYEKAIGQER